MHTPSDQSCKSEAILTREAKKLIYENHLNFAEEKTPIHGVSWRTRSRNPLSPPAIVIKNNIIRNLPTMIPMPSQHKKYTKTKFEKRTRARSFEVSEGSPYGEEAQGRPRWIQNHRTTLWHCGASPWTEAGAHHTSPGSSTLLRHSTQRKPKPQLPPDW